jgi:hypothetical protein
MVVSFLMNKARSKVEERRAKIAPETGSIPAAAID